MGVAVIVVAAGSGTRLKADAPKAFVPVGARSMLERALEPIAQLPALEQAIVVVPADRLQQAERMLEAAGLAGRGRAVIGGAERQDSVLAGLAVLADAADTVLVHDAARPFTPVEVFERVIERVGRLTDGEGGAVPVVPVVDTLKQVDGEQIAATVDRSEVRAVQTPQGFPRAVIEAANRELTGMHTDDAGIVQRAGLAVVTVEGHPRAFKITTQDDLLRGMAMYAEDPALPRIRVGTGTDVHAFDAASPLWLAGLLWPDQPGLSGHSDGDAVAHAIVDALLGAAGLGDIGGMFGTDDPRFAGASGTVFIEGAIERLHAAGWKPVNVSVQLIGNRPKLGPRRDEAQQAMSEAVGAPVSIAATTSDALGFTGRGEGVAATATALITRL
ncbi:2-C-methyl-D-erythritol 4-phosphate cytidylyltransferase [Agrococcus casei]|uniref:Bifunctional enzyme IspD/IspF n=2 Tax=Agrococcus TaxID=46352 RepID=A0A1R4EUQ4_9MICO|nr:2-C-methyl-D-erythritol 4-phosphate cytidylyltransferase [Agrococcus casei]SJM47383.1 2-C-methyl-D-erythritol 2,4-cyclodiphosphate synthase [Agrococcus casei LMG 22410]